VGDLLHREGLSKPYSRRSLPPGRSSVIDPTAPNESWAADWIEQGLICILTAVEPCLSYGIIRNREAQHLQLRPRHRKCLYLYHYQIHPIFCFMHARIQTWFPFAVQICLNGREWLARAMDAAGLGYVRRDNCFTWLWWGHDKRGPRRQMQDRSWELLLYHGKQRHSPRRR
jgi:hypothetical protein